MISQGLTEDSLKKVILVFIIFFIAIGIGFIWWFYSYKPLRDSAKSLIKELEE
jgi:predicted permease